MSDVCPSVAYIGPRSRTERPRKTRIGTEVAHVTSDSDTTLKVKRSTCRGGDVLWRPSAQLVPIVDERAGVQVKLLNSSRTRAIPECFRGADSP